MVERVTAVVGLTGGIASGKSTVAERWRTRGARVIDADLVARAVVEPGEPALAQIVATFGAGMLRDDGALDRARLGELVFSDPAALSRLNAITHPAIMARVGRHLLQARRDGLPWVVYEAALVIENQLAPGLDLLVAVICAPETQIARLATRNGLDAEAARKRLAAQVDNDRRREVADVVIANDGTLDALLAEADRVFDDLVGRFGALQG